MCTHGAPGEPSPLTLWSKVPITPTPRRSTFTSGGIRMVWPPKIEYEWISTSGDVKSAYRKSTTPPPNRANVVIRLGTFQRPRRSKPLMIASSIVDGAGWTGPPLAASRDRAGQVGGQPVEFVVRLRGVGPGQAIFVLAQRQPALSRGIGQQLRHLNPIGVSSTHRTVPRRWSAHH